MKPSVWHLYCEKNIWFRASGTFFEQVIKYSVSYHGTEWQCQGLSRLCLSDFYQVVFPIEAVKRECRDVTSTQSRVHGQGYDGFVL